MLQASVCSTSTSSSATPMPMKRWDWMVLGVDGRHVGEHARAPAGRQAGELWPRSSTDSRPLAASADSQACLQRSRHIDLGSLYLPKGGGGGRVCGWRCIICFVWPTAFACPGLEVGQEEHARLLGARPAFV